MESEDVIPLPDESERDEANESSHEVGEAGEEGDVRAGESLRPSLDNADVEEGQFISTTEIDENAVIGSSFLPEEVDVRKADDTQISGDVNARFDNGCLNDAEVEEGQLIDMEIDENEVANSSILHDNIVIATRVVEANAESGNLPVENGCVTVPPSTDVASTSGTKRTRATFDEQQPSVQVKYYGLSRESKHKLEELLREWSEWHARHSSQRQDDGIQETGEETYFPALDIGTGKNSAVTFWLESEIRKPEDTDFIPVEDASVPLYDRGFSLGSISAEGLSNVEGGSEFLDAPRCFNCSSYSHSLKECPKPRNNDAVNNSRKQLKSKRNQTAGMRNPTRYYQDTPGGKYEGLRPGTLDAETRRLLGLGEADPPPWLNRMREIGYPPGYLEPEDENLPSGITIFADEEIKEEKEDGEILEPELGDVPRKMSVKYPGVNAPIPNNADEKVWAARSSNPDRHGNGDNGRSNRSSESNFRGRFREQNNQDFKDDDPLGFDRPSRYASRYNVSDFNSTSRSWREDYSRPRSPNNGRSTGERGRNDPSDSEDSLAYHLYSSFSYTSDRGLSDHKGVDVSKGERADYTPSSRDRDDKHRRHRER
ncbi:hypothetical protein RND81_06G071600 [Saponaria officinalis]|uniref:PSP proline-rich domain-containing protein n=1 Tax=Saponaria officinalis TaxID=3572 RepID=A0AAW1K6Y0_SAPOF